MSLWRRTILGALLLALALPGMAPALSIVDHYSPRSSDRFTPHSALRIPPSSFHLSSLILHPFQWQSGIVKSNIENFTQMVKGLQALKALADCAGGLEVLKAISVDLYNVIALEPGTEAWYKSLGTLEGQLGFEVLAQVLLALTTEGMGNAAKIGAGVTAKGKGILTAITKLGKTGEKAGEIGQGLAKVGKVETQLAKAGEGIAGSAKNINPLKGKLNCVNCADAMNATLEGNPACALLSGPKSISVLGKNWIPVSGQAEVEALLLKAGPGAKGIVYGADATGGEVGHVWNAVNQKNVINFIDAQAGAGGAKNFAALKDFQFLLME